MKVLVTGSSGFIGSALCIKLLFRGDFVTGIDNHNDYYDPTLKEARLKRHINNHNYEHFNVSILDAQALKKVFMHKKYDCVVNLAAQAGVRYSILNPISFINNNLIGFTNILESCKDNGVRHLVYASSSSVYGLNSNEPYSAHDAVNHPISVYAATKKSNELLAHSYSYQYKLSTTGLRFFTVYGPYDRPDMALQKFTKSILNDEPIKIFNYGYHRRDFTYIDDIVDGIIKIIDKPAKENLNWDSKIPDPASSSAPYRVYNIGNNDPVKILDVIEKLEIYLNKKAIKIPLPIQPGDVESTHANIDDLTKDFDFKPKISLKEGLRSFVNWYIKYY